MDIFNIRDGINTMPADKTGKKIKVINESKRAICCKKVDYRNFYSVQPKNYDKKMSNPSSTTNSAESWKNSHDTVSYAGLIISKRITSTVEGFVVFEEPNNHYESCHYRHTKQY